MEGSYQEYPEYRTLKYPFLKKIPKAWGVVPLSVLSDFRQGKLHEPYVHEEGDFICVNSRFVSTEGEKYKFCTKNLSPVKKSDILMVMSDLPNGRALAKALFVEGVNNYALNQRVCAITPTKIDARFLYYLLNRNPYFLAFDDGCNQTNLSNDVFKKFPVILPPKNEQQKIAKFLDHETAKIKTLITKQEKLIALLKEKRQAVITHAVTRGLNPNARMKESDVEWLGEVPENWKVGCLGYYASLSTGATPSRAELSYWNGDIPWIKTGEVRYEAILDSEEKITEDGLVNSSVKLSPPGTILMAMYGQGVTRGRVAILGIEATYNQACAAINVNNQVINEYLIYFFIAAYSEIRDTGNATSQMNLNADIVQKFKITVPTIKEQNEITKYLDIQTSNFDALILKADFAIDLMKERKLALVSAAVTGKIDVRDWQGV
jgi:type I restriction enzyme S subunit